MHKYGNRDYTSWVPHLSQHEGKVCSTQGGFNGTVTYRKDHSMMEKELHLIMKETGDLGLIRDWDGDGVE